MTIDVMLFARAKQIAGCDEVAVEAPEQCTVSELLAALVNKCPELSQMHSSLLVAVNNQFADRSTLISGTDKVACFPPVSGG